MSERIGWGDERADEALGRLADQISRKRGIPMPMVPPLRPGILDEDQRRILVARASGLTNRETAEVLGYTLDTIKYQLQRIRDILGAKTTTAACCRAIRLRLIP